MYYVYTGIGEFGAKNVNGEMSNFWRKREEKSRNMEGFANTGSNELLEKILELTKNGYDFEEADGGVEVRFFYMEDVDGGISPERREKCVSDLYKRFIELGIFGYNWDTIPFSLEVDRVEGVDCVRCWLNLSSYHLDEWYILYLCHKMTESVESLAVQVVSSDGDPVLIDLADILPAWMKPSNSTNRCFLVNGRVYLIPPELLEDETRSLSLKSALCIVKSRIGCCYTEESFTSTFMKKFESISRINLREKSHNFFVILPRRVAGMVLEFHYLLAVSLKYLLGNRYGSSEVRVLEKKQGSDEELSLFLPSDLVRVRICMTRTQYTRFVNEALLEALPPRFSNSSWARHLPENLRDKKFNSELSHGCFLTYGLYLAYLINPRNSLNVFIWKFTSAEKLLERSEDSGLQTLVKDSQELMRDLKSLRNDDFRTLWVHLSSNSRPSNAAPAPEGGDEDAQCDSSSWMNNDEYSKQLIEDIQKIYSENSQLTQKKGLSFTEMMEEKSYFDGVELSLNDPHGLPHEYDTADLSDLSLESDLSQQDFDELNEIMKSMDEELRRTLKTSVPSLSDKNEMRKYAEDTYSKALKLEESFGVVGPATVFHETQKER